MLEKNGYLEPELEDVLAAIDLGTDHLVKDWPWGRKQRCQMHFSVEKDPRRGERFVKQSRMDGRTYKPKKGTYASRVKIIEIDGKIGHIVWTKHFGHIGVRIEDGKYCSKAFFDDEAVQLARVFFKD